MRYVGLTEQPAALRLEQHFAVADSGLMRPLHIAIREHRRDAFVIEVAPEDRDIPVEELGTLAPNGYNANRGGQVGGARVAEWTLPDGRVFPSRKKAAHVVPEQTGIPVGTILNCWKAGRDLPDLDDIRSGGR